MYNFSIPIFLNSVLSFWNWYKQPIVSLKQSIVFPALCFYCLFWKTEFLIKVLLKNFHSKAKSLQKSSLNNSPPLSFKAIYSNNWYQSLVLESYSSWSKFFCSMNGKLSFEEGASIYKLLGLLVSKFKRGGVNWAYKIFARTHNFSVFLRQKEQIVFTWNRLILQSSLDTIWILFNVKLWSTENYDRTRSA